MKLTQLIFGCKECQQPMMIESIALVDGEDEHTYVEVGCICLPCQKTEVEYKYFSLESLVTMSRKPMAKKNKFGFHPDEKPDAEA